MLDITAFSNALHQGRVSFLASLGVGPFVDGDGSVVAIAGDDAVIFPLGAASDTPKYALRLPLEHSSGTSWPRHYADISSVTGTVADSLPTGITILDVDDIPGTGVALLYDWVPGETLTYRVTRARSRHERDQLEDLLWPLADLAESLRVSGMAHGDIAPGNIVVRPDGTMVLVDLDRMRHRDDEGSVEARRRAGYRIPRGGGSPSEEDAFALLILMSSCAILADSNVPIEHDRAPESAHPSLLFSSWDLMDLQRSRLVREVEQQLTPISRGLLDLLSTASSGPSNRIPAVLRDAVRRIRHHLPKPEAGMHSTAQTGWQPVRKLESARHRDHHSWPEDRWEATTESIQAVPAEAVWPDPAPSREHEHEDTSSESWSLPHVDELLQRLRTLPTVQGRGAGSRRRADRAERRRQAVSDDLHRALRENDREVLVRLAMSGSLAELGDSDRAELLGVVRALAHDSIARAVTTDDDSTIVAAVDDSVFERERDIDPAFQERVRLARDRVRWTDLLHDAVRDKDARVCQTLISEAPEDGVDRLPDAIRNQATRLAEQREAEVAASEAIRRRDADGLARALAKLVCIRPTWTDSVDVHAVVDLLSEEQIEERLVRELRGGTLSDEHQWMADIVIAAGRLPEVTRIAGLTPRDVDGLLYRQS